MATITEPVNFLNTVYWDCTVEVELDTVYGLRSSEGYTLFLPTEYADGKLPIGSRVLLVRQTGRVVEIV